MDRLYLERLYSHYQAGHVNDSGKTSPLLQIARATGQGLTLDQFAKLASAVDRVQERRDNKSITTAEYQESLWSIPRVFNSMNGRPVNQIDRENRDRVTRSQGDVPLPNAQSSEALVRSVSGTDSFDQNSLEVSGASSLVDKLQMGLDAWGVAGDAVIPGTGVAADGINAAISVGRMFTDPKRAGTHLFNAAVSTASMIPFIGDAAKLFKYGRQGVKAMRTAGATAGKAAGRIGGDSAEMAAKRAAIDEDIAQKIAEHRAFREKRNMPVSEDYINSLETLRKSKHNSLGGTGGAGTGIASGMLSSVLGGLGIGGGAAGGGAGSGSGGSGGGGSSILSGGFFGSFGGKALGGAAVVIGAAVLALKRFVGWLEQVDEKGKALLNSYDHLKELNGQVANAYERLEIDRQHRTIGMGRYMGGSLASLAGAQSKYEGAMEELKRPYERFGVNAQAIQTKAATFGAEVLHKLDFVGRALGGINYLIEKYVNKASSPEGNAFSQTMDRFSLNLKEKFGL